MSRNSLPYTLHRRSLSQKNRFVYYCRFRDPDTGERLTAVSTGQSSKAAATTWADEQLRAGHITRRERASRPTPPRFGPYLREFYTWETSTYIQGRIKRGKNFTKASAEIALGVLEKYAVPFFGEDRKLSSIGPADLERWMLDMAARQVGKTVKRPIAPAYINRVWTYLRTALKEAARLRLTPEDPTGTIKPFAPQSAARGILTPAEAALVLDPARWSDHRLWAANFTMAATGLRLGEVRALMPKSIHPDHIQVEFSFSVYDGLKGTKTGKVRAVPIPSRVAEVLGELSKGLKPDAYLFASEKRPKASKENPNPKPAPLVPGLFIEALREVMDGLGIEHQARGIVCHSWRHLFATLMRGKVPDFVAAKLTGHTTPIMLNHYTDHDTDENMEAVRAVQREAFGLVSSNP